MACFAVFLGLLACVLNSLAAPIEAAYRIKAGDKEDDFDLIIFATIENNQT